MTFVILNLTKDIRLIRISVILRMSKDVRKVKG